MSKFTPGPWGYRKTHTMSETAWYVITHHDGRGPVMDVGGSDLNGQISEAKHLITNPEEIEANARLIAAAPDMYQLLEKMQNTFQMRGEGPMGEWLANQIEKVLEKATKGHE